MREPLPRQAHDEGVELCPRERGLLQRSAIARPDEAALVEAARGAPHTEAVMHHQLHPRAARVGEEVAVVKRTRGSYAGNGRSI